MGTLVRAVGVAAMVLITTGCSPGDYRFTDNVELELRFSRGEKDHLATPYVVGAEMSLGVFDEDDDRNTDFTGWTLVSSDPEVFTVLEPRSNHRRIDASGIAVAEGDADLLLLDEVGDFVTSVEVVVRFPNRVELLAAAPAFLRRDDVPADAPRPQVLVDSRIPRRDSSDENAFQHATFLVRYYADDIRLNGNNALEVAHDDGIEAWVDYSYFSQHRDWLKVRVEDEGAHTLEMRVGNRPFTTTEIHGVGAEAIDRVELFGRDESRAEPGDHLVVIAQAFDESSEPIYGVAYTWNIRGEESPEVGDMFRYTYDPDARSTISADFDGLGAEAVIRGAEGHVGSSNEISCRVGARDRFSGWGLLLLGIGIAARRRSPSARR